MNFTDSLDELNIILGDSGDVTFSTEEKQRALKKAWRDTMVVKTVWDSSLTYSMTTDQYAIPSSITVVKDIYINPTNSVDGQRQKIAANLWEAANGYIYFKNRASFYIEDGYTLYIKGTYKYAYDSDTITDPGMQEYVLALAGYNTLSLLGYKKANLFLKNDVSMAELIALRREFERDVIKERARLARGFEAI